MSGEVSITDTVSGRGVHQAVSRLHLSGPVEPAGGGGVRLGRILLALSGGQLTVIPSGHGNLGKVASGFGLLAPATCIESRLVGILPLTTALHISADAIVLD
jgi:hypothetical protein